MDDHIKASICSFLYNIDSSRCYNLSIEKSSTAVSVNEEQPNTTKNNLPYILIQHRPAYLEQLVLRINKIPFLVQNSYYSVNECTGAYPCLIDPNTNVIIGRNDPSSMKNSIENKIISFINEKNLDTTIGQDEKQKSQNILLCNLIKHSLEPAVTYFNCQKKNNSLSNIFFYPLFHKFQTFAMNQNQIKLTMNLTTEKALSFAEEAYQAIEMILSNQTNLLETTEYTFVDALFYAHISEALLETELVKLMIKKPNICKFYKCIKAKYFSGTNNITNQENAYFVDVPIDMMISGNYDETESGKVFHYEKLSKLKCIEVNLDDIVPTEPTRCNGDVDKVQQSKTLDILGMLVIVGVMSFGVLKHNKLM